MDYKDKEAIASIALLANRSMAEKAKGISRSEAERLGYTKRTDFRTHLNGNGYTPGGNFPSPPQFHEQFNHPNWQNNVPQNVQGWNAPFEEDPSNINLARQNNQIPQIPIPGHIANNVQNFGIPGEGIMSESFRMPDYNNPSKQNGNGIRISLEDEEEFRDALIKEVKALKKIINKLNRENDKLIIKVTSMETILLALSKHLNLEIVKEETPITPENEIIPES